MAHDYISLVTEHPFIWAWAKYLGSTSAAFIRSELEKAHEDGAPADAIFKDSEGKWRTASETKNLQALQSMAASVANLMAKPLIDDPYEKYERASYRDYKNGR